MLFRKCTRDINTQWQFCNTAVTWCCPARSAIFNDLSLPSPVKAGIFRLLVSYQGRRLHDNLPNDTEQTSSYRPYGLLLIATHSIINVFSVGCVFTRQCCNSFLLHGEGSYTLLKDKTGSLTPDASNHHIKESSKRFSATSDRTSASPKY